MILGSVVESRLYMCTVIASDNGRQSKDFKAKINEKEQQIMGPPSLQLDTGDSDHLSFCS